MIRRVHDIKIESEFFSDYDLATPQVQRKINQLIRHISRTGNIPRGMQAHKAESKEYEIWIGHVTRTRQHWRLLYFLENGIMYLYRLVDHDTMDILLKEIL